MKVDRLAVGLALAGSLICNAVLLVYINRSSGTMLVDRTNDEKDLYRLEIDDLDALSKKKRVIIKVDNNANLSR